MNEEQNHKRNFNAEDIRRYLDGSMPAQDRHALEKTALDDPFLQDALEGMQLQKEKENSFSANADMEELQQRLKERIQKKDGRLFILPRWFRVAAAVILLAGAAWILNTILGRATNSSVADQFPKEPLSADTSQRKLASPDSISSNPKKEPTVAVADTVRSKSNALVSKNKKEDKKTPAASDYNVTITPTPAPILPSKADTLVFHYSTSPAAGNTASTFKNAETPTESKSFGKIPPLDTKTFRVKKSADSAQHIRDLYMNGRNLVAGKVVDENNRPIPDAVITLRNQPLSVLTDMKGKFTFILQRPDSVLDVTIASAGFQTTEASLRNNYTTNMVTLPQNNQSLNNMVIDPKGNTFNKAKQLDEDLTKDADSDMSLANSSLINQDAEPVSGWPAYRAYLNKSKKINTADSTVHGNEIISFVVNSKGSLGSFRIEQSLSPSHDAETLRLIRQGPSWKLLRGRKSKVTLQLSY